MDMVVPTYNFTWQQGEDAVINLTYKVNGTPVDLTGYSLRMDVVGANQVSYTFNTQDQDPETVDEVILGSDGSINIELPRSVTLPNGPLFNAVGQALEYDVFLRTPANKQSKILKGTVTIEASKTLWAN